ncbi:MAG: hypothetical protein RTV41_01055 [Candidatus Thorarchaeota archaeon]
MDVIQYILMVILILTAGGWCLDWVFSGSVNPIYTRRSDEKIHHQYSTITCRVCSHEVRYSIQKMKASGEVKCDRCGSFLKK